MVGALVNTVFLLALCFTILIEALQRFASDEIIEDPDLLLIVGGIGLGINIIGLFMFGSHSHGHSHGGHGHSHGSHGHAHDDDGQSHTANQVIGNYFFFILDSYSGPVKSEYMRSYQKVRV